MSTIRRAIMQLEQLVFEKKAGVKDLKFPGDCGQRDLLRAAERDAEVKHGGNHDTVVDPSTGTVITQIPRHDPKPGTCRRIIKDLQKALASTGG